MSPLPIKPFITGSSSTHPFEIEFTDISAGKYAIVTQAGSFGAHQDGEKTNRGPSHYQLDKQTTPRIRSMKSVSFAPAKKIELAISPANITPCAIISGANKILLIAKNPRPHARSG